MLQRGVDPVEVPPQSQGALPPLQAPEYLAVPAPLPAVDLEAQDDKLLEDRASGRSDGHFNHGQAVLQGDCGSRAGERARPEPCVAQRYPQIEPRQRALVPTGGSHPADPLRRAGGVR